jgi:hypothetical protein
VFGGGGGHRIGGIVTHNLHHYYINNSMELPQIYENMLIEYCSGNLINESFIGDYIQNTDEFDMELVEEIKLDEYTLF